MRFFLNFFFFLLSLIFLLNSCKDEPTAKRTFFGGEIIHPSVNYITIAKNEEILDTVYLDENNQFSYEFDEEANGLFTFRHPPESQIFYLKDKDSLLMHVNTLEFDESLMYSGYGSEENNFLMETYLLNEKNNDLVYSYYKISPAEFARKTDSIKAVREERLIELTNKHDFSDDFVEIANQSINYEYYDLRERYSFLINKYFNQFRSNIPKDFFNYRKEVDFNNEEFQSSYIYQRFLDNYLKNCAIEYCIENSSSRDCFSLNNVQNLRRRLILADSLFTLDNLHERFVGRFARKQIIFSESETQIDSTLHLLTNFDYPQEKLDKLRRLGEIQRSFFIGHNISNTKLINTDLNKIFFKDISDQPIISFYWSIYATTQHKIQHQRINELRNRYPEIEFVGINIDDGETELWQKTLDNFDYNTDFEYQLRESGDKKPLYRNYLNKILFIDKDGEIIYGQIELDDPDIENYILQFLNR